MYKVNDFFCGAGGFGLGFKQSGYELVGAWDFDQAAVESYKNNVSSKVELADISKLTWEDIPEANIWTFGFPCQDISLQGKGAGMIKGKTRSGLFYEIIRLLEETAANKPDQMPRIILAENVKNVRKYLATIEEEYKKVGYKMSAAVYNSKHYGVPQHRERYYIIGVRESIQDEFEHKPQENNPPKLQEILESSVDEKYYISHEEAKVIIKREGDKLHIREATKKGYKEAVAGDSINIAFPDSKTRRGRVGHGVTQTLLTKNEHLVIEEDLRTRELTPREYARLQGFPDEYIQVVNDQEFYKQMGNAVTVTIAKSIADQIKSFLDKGGNDMQEINIDALMNHELYRRNQKALNEVTEAQIIKGYEKYRKPLNSSEWSGKQLIRHAREELVDLGHYIAALEEHIELLLKSEREIENKYEDVLENYSLLKEKLRHMERSQKVVENE